MIIYPNRRVQGPLPNIAITEKLNGKETGILNRDTVTISPDAQAKSGHLLSGKVTMLKRLFNVENPSEEPRIETTVNDSNVAKNVNTWLTKEDRTLLSDAYEYASKVGIDASEIDLVAFDLGNYRKHEHTGGNRDITGRIDLPDGRPFIDMFSQEDEAQARAILSLKAMEDTKIDRGFLEVELDPGRGGSGHAADFGVLRELVLKFSSDYSDGAKNPDVSFADRDARAVLAQAVQAAAPFGLRQAGESVGDGKALMSSRLFGGAAALGAQDSGTKRLGFTGYLSDDDKNMLSGLYASAQANGVDLKEVDKLAEALGALRKSEAHIKEQRQLISGLALS